MRCVLRQRPNRLVNVTKQQGRVLIAKVIRRPSVQAMSALTYKKVAAPFRVWRLCTRIARAGIEQKLLHATRLSCQIYSQLLEVGQRTITECAFVRGT
jgi:hypothetical protein